MEYIYIGDVVNTHGIKGEVRLKSNFKYKSAVFKKDMKVYIGRFKDEQIINNHRVHKDFDMLTFVGVDNINDVIGYKGDALYVNRLDLEIDGYVHEDIIGLNVIYKEKNIGKVEYIIENKAHEILVVGTNNGNALIPYIDEYIEQIDLVKKEIHIIEMEGLIDED